MFSSRFAQRPPAPDDPLIALAERVRAADDRSALAGRSRAAAQRPELPVHYQPVVDLSTGDVAAREALVRWRDRPGAPTRLPTAFIGLAEEMGVIVAIGRRILNRACADAAGWEGVPAVHVNVSPVELTDPGFAAGVRDALQRSGLAADRLVLELTASATADDASEPLQRALREVRELGVGIALDRFGNGPVSLASLQTLPLDWLKVGPPFVHDLAPGGAGRALIAMILQLADSLGLRVVAEGIETREQMSVLRSLGAGYGQGYFLGSPAAAAGPAFPIDEPALAG